MHKQRLPRVSFAILITVLVALTAASNLTSTLPVSTASASPEHQVQAAWRRAQQSGVYHYTTEIAQTTCPAPMLTNVGRSARQARLYIEGQTNLPDREMLMTLWQSGGNVVTGREGVEVRIKGDQAYGHTTGADWQKIDDFSSVFAASQDLMAYLAGAKNVRAGRPATEFVPPAAYSRPSAKPFSSIEP